MNKKRMTKLIAGIVLFILGLMTLSGCQPTPYVTEGETIEVTVAATAVALKTVSPTETLVATETSVATDDTVKMQPTEPLKPTPTVTSDAVKPESVAPDSSEPAIIYERSGGYAGLTDQWEIYADGRITYNDGNNRVMEWQVEPADVTQLQAEIIALDFFALESSYIPKNACCDLFTYSITVTDGTQTHTTTTVDQAASAPDNLWATLELVQAFIADNSAN